jgi:sec-independent protein translocase protein TatC
MALVPFPSKSSQAAAEPSDPDWDDSVDKDDEPEGAGKMSFLEHLDELRRRIIYSLLALVVGIIVACVFLIQLKNFVMTPMYTALKSTTLIFTEPTEGMMLYVKIALIAGVLIASPGILWQVWQFIAPGLYVNEKKLAIPFVVLGTVLAVGGAAFAHYQAFPLTWSFLGSFEDERIKFMPRVAPAFNMYLTLVLMFAAIFQLPTLVLFLARMGLVTARFLIKNFKYAILIIVIAAALLSPGQDPVGQVVFAVPMIILYCFSIVLAWLFGKKKRQAEPAEA